MSESEPPAHVPAPTPGPEPVVPNPAPAPTPVPSTPALLPEEGHAPAGSLSPSRWARLHRGTVLTLGVGAGAAAMGACWLTVSLIGGDTVRAEGGSPSNAVTAEESKPPEPFGTDGTITLTDVGAGLEDGAPCSGTGGYSDIDFGTQVNVTDAAGTLVATSSLGLGEKTQEGCAFTFTVDEITPGSKFYTVEVSHRGGLTQTETELRAGGLEFTLGD